MYSFAILVTLKIVSLISGQDSTTSFTLHQIESKTSIKSGSAAVLSAYHKFNKPAPEHVRREVLSIMAQLLLHQPYTIRHS